MIQSSVEKNVISKNAAVFAVRVGLLLLLISSALLVTGCASVSSDDRETFYSGWANPNSKPPVQ